MSSRPRMRHSLALFLWLTAAGASPMAAAVQQAEPPAASALPAEPSVDLAALQRAAAGGDARAEFDLALYYARPDVPDRSDALSVEWLTKSAEHGFADAQHTIGLLYLAGGRGVAVDAAQAAAWWQRAADQGLDVSLFALAQLYDAGAGVPQDLERAAALWRRAAEQGHASSQNMLGKSYFEGRGVPQDDGLALEWWTKAAGGGQAPAMLNIGTAYSVGRGVEKSDEQAVAWWWKAADAGNLTAMNNVGAALASGTGIEKNLEKAADWWRKGADLGDPRAQYLLAMAHFNGAGVDFDLIESYKWLYIATNLTSGQNQVFYINVRDSVGTNMTGEALAEAQKRAREWMAARQ